MSQIGFLGAPIFQALDGEGIPIAGGLVWCYEAGTDFEKDMYGSISDAINVLNPLPNPMTLNSAGRASIVFSGASKFVLEGNDIDPNTGHGSIIWTADNVGSFGDTVFDPNGNIIVDYGYQDDGINYLKFTNAPIGSRPIIDFTGLDDNVGGLIRMKGTNYSLKLENDSGGYQFPLTDGASSYCMVTDGAGQLSWAPNAGSGGATAVPTGAVIDYAGTGTPSGGYLLCDGAAVSRATYSDLFTAIGTTWGIGDGVNTFNLPNFNRRVRMGSGGTGTSTIGNAVGNTGGAETVTLTTAQMPAHTHDYVRRASTVVVDTALTVPGNASSIANTTVATSSTGSGQSHNNIQPSAIVRVFIKT